MTTDNSEVARPAYSPQDARSGPPGQGPWTEKGSITGSPEARKRKKQAKSPTKVAATAENPSSVLEAGVAVTSQLLESETSAEMTVQENPTSQQIEDAVTSPKFEAVPEGEGAQPVNTKRKATSSDETTYHTPPAEKSVSALDAPSTTQQTTVPGEEELPEKSEAAGSVQDALICPSAIVELTADDEQRETIAAVEDPALDEEQQNDSSFHSAKEALSDSSKDEVKDEAKDEVTEEAKDEAKDDDRRDDLKSSEKKVGDGAEKSEKESSQQSAINPTNSTGDNIDTQMFHPDATNSTKPPPTEKKPGAKQTEPLFPFKSKAQIKKEKEQKKKERKKAKTEKPSVTTKTNAQADETEPQTQLPPPAISASNGTKSLQVKVAVPVLKTPSQTPSIESGPVVAVKAPSKTEVASPITIGTEKILDEVRSEDGVSMASSATLKANTPPMSPKHVVTGCPPANMSSAAVPPAAKKAKPKKKKKKPAVVSPEPGETSTAPSIRGAFTEQLNLIDRVKGSEDSVSYYTRPDMTDDGEQKVTEAELLEDVARFLQERREQFDALPQRVRESLAKRAAAETSESALTANVDEGKRRA
ncbi:hypothetical protein M011DRAFT_121152 [Sporormia fimetaria CBS 119925]|uniref:Uncharacterized protein n=1 Tax=Sporormia fimetaria CBS 119925 TaxID=1340428 RepID=A0A6A6V5F3_9PLEO|nr:hypothetical protein M011DRAFT_121152 [Sporormia fimetaria CBS 119925]